MAPKVTPHASNSNSEAQIDDEGAPGRSRTSLKKERVNNEQALSQLAAGLLEFPPSTLDRLGLSDDVIEAVAALRTIKSFAARDRQLRLVRARLRDLDWMQLRADLDRHRAGLAKAPTASVSEEARIWTEQLIVQKDEGLGRFMQRYEEANRKRLRQLILNVHKTGESKRHRARHLLLVAVDEVLSLNARNLAKAGAEPERP